MTFHFDSLTVARACFGNFFVGQEVVSYQSGISLSKFVLTDSQGAAAHLQVVCQNSFVRARTQQ